MIRALRIALANWIMPNGTVVARPGTRFIREARANSMLTVIDGKMVEVALPTNLHELHLDQMTKIIQEI